MSYITDCLQANITLDIDDYVTHWHISDSGVSLSDFLGITRQEYYEWVKQDDNIHKIVAKYRTEYRKQKIENLL